MINVKKRLICFVFLVIGILGFESVYAADVTCKYIGQINNGSITITYNDLYWGVTYPDGKARSYFYGKAKNNVFPSTNCEDIFYSKSENIIKAVDSSSIHSDTLIGQYCRKYSDLEQFCANGNCNIEKPLCGSDIGAIEGNDYGECPKELKPIIYFVKKVAFNTLQIIVPILLIVMGSVDLFKAVAASDDKAIKDSISKFIKRALTAILCFFIVTIVTIVMDMFAKTDVGDKSDWKSCWHNID